MIKGNVIAEELVMRDVYDDFGRLLIKSAIFKRSTKEILVGVGSLLTRPMPICRLLYSINKDYYLLLVHTKDASYVAVVGKYNQIKFTAGKKLVLMEGEEQEKWMVELKNARHDSIYPNGEFTLFLKSEYTPVWLCEINQRVPHSSMGVYFYITNREGVIFKPPTPNSFPDGRLCLGYSTTWEAPDYSNLDVYADRFMNHVVRNESNSDLDCSIMDQVFEVDHDGNMRCEYDKPLHAIINEFLFDINSAISMHI